MRDLPHLTVLDVPSAVRIWQTTYPSDTLSTILAGGFGVELLSWLCWENRGNPRCTMGPVGCIHGVLDNDQTNGKATTLEGF